MEGKGELSICWASIICQSLANARCYVINYPTELSQQTIVQRSKMSLGEINCLRSRGWEIVKPEFKSRPSGLKIHFLSNIFLCFKIPWPSVLLSCASSYISSTMAHHSSLFKCMFLRHVILDMPCAFVLLCLWHLILSSPKCLSLLYLVNYYSSFKT